MLGVAESTAASHCKNIMSKLGGRNRAHACYLAVCAGLLAFDGEDIRVCH